MNGDGQLDFAVATTDSNTVSVLLGNGNGTFQDQQTFATGLNPRSVALGDVNGDGKLDLVVANYGSNSVSVLLGNGNGTFQNQQTFATGSSPRSVTLGDVNGDGQLDLGVANRDSATVSVLLGNGNGTFRNQQTFATGSAPYSVTLGDVNDDGKLDLAVANSGDATVSVLHNSSNEVFIGQSYSVIGNVPTDIGVSNSSVAENGPHGTAIGTFTSTDPDAGNTFTYSLASGSGDTGNGSFQIVGDALTTNASFDFESQSSYSIRVRTTDQNGLWFEKEFMIGVVNQPEGTAGNDAFVLTYSASSVAITISTNGGATTSLGAFALTAPLTLFGLGGTDSVKIVGTSGSDVIQVSSS